ncbi:DUF202 domain-containing protein [Altererythrobacter salegens]|uniref:DUF202 domain-containing protein n=1 Tax=Croceibacterium salegens TaxID=1737568 RepID=A0A6I4SUU0_9SPHN|nr:DUF202 domain-containing protein [Croceibacterium salegens]MXO58576.1 DUF202 domain-containing protein [Croceibacterium salegens]
MTTEGENGDTTLLGGDMSSELSANRTAMSFERTALSAHRTLLSMMQASLSLIGFGFTIFQFFTSLSNEYLKGEFPQHTARLFGLAMVSMGLILLSLGIYDHYKAMTLLRERKRHLVDLGLVHNYLPIRIASSMAISILMLLLGLLALADILFSL